MAEIKFAAPGDGFCRDAFPREVDYGTAHRAYERHDEVQMPALTVANPPAIMANLNGRWRGRPQLLLADPHRLGFGGTVPQSLGRRVQRNMRHRIACPESLSVVKDIVQLGPVPAVLQNMVVGAAVTQEIASQARRLTACQ